MELIVAGLGALGTVAGLILAWYGGKKSERANRIAAHAVALEWQRDLRSWADEAIGVLAEGSYGCDWQDTSDADADERIMAVRLRLSALIDRGRFFLPNQPDEEMGKEKPTAYQGWRHSALDPLVAAERVLGGKSHGRFETREHALIAMRREFVSAIQRILSPERQNREISRLIAEAHERVPDNNMGGLLPDSKVLPTGADRLLSVTGQRNW